MYYGWMSETELNRRTYGVWQRMLERCYSEKYQKNNPSYKGCYVCNRWLKLSNFVEDISKIDNYEFWKNNPNKRIALDKDVKSNNENKCYCLEQCMFITQEENSKQSHINRDYTIYQGENNIWYGKTFPEEMKRKMSNAKISGIVVRCDKEGNIIKVYNGTPDVQKDFNINKSNIIKCCKGKTKSAGKDENGNKLYWKYLKDIPNEIILNYIIKNMQFKGE